MGATVTLGAGRPDRERRRGRSRGIDADLHEVGELTPTLAALAALARTPSRLRGIAHLRGHETDRLAALVARLGALGGDVRETEDGLEIRPETVARRASSRPTTTIAWRPPGPYSALSFPGSRSSTSRRPRKTLPDFVGQWLRMLGR